MPTTNAVLAARQIQMNTRIDAGLKEAGDAVLARLGYTPSVAVRGLWQFMVDHQDDAASIREVIEPGTALAISDEASRKASAIAGLRSLYERMIRELGMPVACCADLPSWDDLREDWYDERLEREA